MTVSRRTLTVLASVIAAALALLAITLVGPATPPPASASTACRVTNATLTWGFKASFRAYIRSSIANGDWTTNGNAGYTTPNFIWRAGTGTFDPAATSGQVGFTGGVHFTGHDGLLDSTFFNPRLKFTSAKTAVLVLDYKGVSMAEALAGSTTPTTYPNVDFAALALASGGRGGSGATTTFTAVPTSITADGFTTFGSYAAGTALDPMTISITTTGSCGVRPPKQAANGGGSSTGAATNEVGTTTVKGATPPPSITAASGLQIPASAAIPAPGSSTSTAGTPAATHASTGGADRTRTLGILASTDSTGGGFGNGFLFGVGGLVVGIAMTLLIQFAHLQLLGLAKRKGVRPE